MSERDLSQIYGNIPADSLNGHSTADLSDPKVTNRWTGKVIANNDSMRMGRVKVKIGLVKSSQTTILCAWAG